MRLVTVATDSEAYFPFLLQSCERFKHSLDVLGWKQKWKGFAWRFQLVHEYLRNVPDDEVVCFVDAYDVVMLRDPRELESAFKEFVERKGRRIVVGAERPFNFIVDVALRWIFGTCDGKFLNAGTYIGFAGDVRSMLRSIAHTSTDPAADDQALMTAFCKSSPGRVHVDWSGDFFLVMTNSGLDKPAAVRNGFLEYEGKCPYVLHGNGQADMNPFVRALGYPLSDQHASLLRSYLLKTSAKKVLVYGPHFYGCCLAAAVCVLCFAFSYARRSK